MATKISSIYLSMQESERMKKVCEKEGCTAYALAKKALLDHIWAYPLENAPPSEEESLKKDLGEAVITDAPAPEPSEMEVEEVSERVRKILEGKKE